jgi:hypothetical protein
MTEYNDLTLSISGRAGPRDGIPYSKESLGQELQRMDRAWEEFQGSRDRDAIYGYLDAVFQAVMLWKKCGWIKNRVRRAVNVREADPRLLIDTFAAVIMCTADPKKVDRRTRSKWSRVLRYAEARKRPSMPLSKFVKRKGGINACASRYTLLQRREKRRAERTS